MSENPPAENPQGRRKPGEKKVSRRENETTKRMRRLEALEEKVELIERGLDINISDATAVLLFVQIHKGSHQPTDLGDMILTRFSREEIELAWKRVCAGDVPSEPHVIVRDVIDGCHPNRFQHRRNDRGSRARKGPAASSVIEAQQPPTG